MLVLKHLNTLQHVSIIIQIIFRELLCSLLKSLILKVFIILFFLICESSIPLHTERHAHKPNVMLSHYHK